MTASPVGRSAWPGVELLERAIGYTRGSLGLVTPERLASTTPCAGWDLRTLLLHMADSLASLHEAGSVRRVALDLTRSTGRDTAEDLVEVLRASACQLLADWSRAGGPILVKVADRQVTAGVLTAAGALEVCVHGWDVAAACGSLRPLPEALAADLLVLTPALVTDTDRGRRFAPPLEVQVGASAADRLLALLGRSPGWLPEH